jgi:hypothetical protein
VLKDVLSKWKGWANGWKISETHASFRQKSVGVRVQMKNIQVIDGADNCVYDIFAATDDEFLMIFPLGHDIAFIDEVYDQGNQDALSLAFKSIWERRIKKSEAIGIHGILFYELGKKKAYYPTRRDEEAMNPDGSLLR